VSDAFTTLDAVVLFAYLIGITLLGVVIGRRRADDADYFLAGRALPWWVICASNVATETSAVTFVSIPATAYTSDFWILQLAFGYLIGRILVAWLLLPGYFEGKLSTAYELLEKRFGPPARSMASAIFLFTRVLADSVRQAVGIRKLS
jgi:Na+/proline symporter